tara:strand:+ start:3578 stop:3937 length:360 start_codon:yes stop_codon:yes gene_type:complete
MTDCKLIVKRKSGTSWLMGMVVQKVTVDYNCGQCTVAGHILAGGTRATAQHKFVEVIVRNIPEINRINDLLIQQDSPLTRTKYQLRPQTTESDPYFIELLQSGIVDVDYSVLETFIEAT